MMTSRKLGYMAVISFQCDGYEIETDEEPEIENNIQSLADIAKGLL